MPRGRRRAKKKVSKTWYDIIASDVFPGQWIGETLASSPDLLYGRRVEVSLRDITGDLMHEKYRLWFAIHRVEGTTAYARFYMEMLNRDFLRSIVQRRSSRVDVQTEGTTKDGHHVRVFNLIITAVRVRHSQERAIRKRVHEYVASVIPELTLEELVRASVLGDRVDVRAEAARLASKIAPIKNSEIRKMVVLKYGEAEPILAEVPQAVGGSSPGGGEGEEA